MGCRCLEVELYESNSRCGALVGQTATSGHSFRSQAAPLANTVYSFHGLRLACSVSNPYVTPASGSTLRSSPSPARPLPMSQPEPPAQPASPALSDDATPEAPLTMAASTLLTTLPVDAKEALATDGKVHVQKGESSSTPNHNIPLPIPRAPRNARLLLPKLSITCSYGAKYASTSRPSAPRPACPPWSS